eukprot:scaffold113276_cov69-Phaeocystis_antarctica.AAC.4
MRMWSHGTPLPSVFSHTGRSSGALVWAARAVPTASQTASCWLSDAQRQKAAMCPYDARASPGAPTRPAPTRPASTRPVGATSVASPPRLRKVAAPAPPVKCSAKSAGLARANVFARIVTHSNGALSVAELMAGHSQKNDSNGLAASIAVKKSAKV